MTAYSTGFLPSKYGTRSVSTRIESFTKQLVLANDVSVCFFATRNLQQKKKLQVSANTLAVPKLNYLLLDSLK